MLAVLCCVVLCGPLQASSSLTFFITEMVRMSGMVCFAVCEYRIHSFIHSSCRSFLSLRNQSEDKTVIQVDVMLVACTRSHRSLASRSQVQCRASHTARQGIHLKSRFFAAYSKLMRAKRPAKEKSPSPLPFSSKSLKLR